LTAAAPALQDLKLDVLVESPSNPRKTWGDLAELVASIREKGVLQPILARPLPGPREKGSATHEVVFGHRRLRAARKAGLATIPAIVRSLDDLAALEAQVIENGQREDIHPLEEALGMAKKRAEAEAAGRQVLTGKAAKAAIESRVKFVKPGDHCWEDPKGQRTWGKLLGKKGLEEHGVLAEGPDGDLVELVPAEAARAALKDVLKASGLSPARSRASSPSSIAASQRREQAKRDLERRVRGRILDEIVPRVKSLDREDMVLVLVSMFRRLWHDDYKVPLSKRWGLRTETEKGTKAFAARLDLDAALDRRLRRLAREDLVDRPEAAPRLPAVLAARILEVALFTETHPLAHHTPKADALLEAAQRYGIDAAAIRREETAAAARPKKKAPKKTRGKKAARRG